MAIFKKERMWSEKLTSAELDIPEIQRGVIAVKKRSRLGFLLPTTVNRVHSVVITPLNTPARTMLKGGYSASQTKVTYNALVSFTGTTSASIYKLIKWEGASIACAEDELLFNLTEKQLYITKRAITKASYISASTTVSTAAAIAAGYVEKLSMFATGVPTFIPIKILVSSLASNGASIGRFAFEVRGYK